MPRPILLLLLVVWLLPGAVMAEVFTNQPQTPYELLPMVISEGVGEYLGTLRDNPVTYELAIATTTELHLRLTQPKAEELAVLGMLVVRELRTGRVELVSRVASTEADWHEEFDRWLGMSWRTLPVHTVTLTPGMYRVEVSSPVNLGHFRLVVGESVGRSGYREMWQRIATINDFYDRPWVLWLDSWFVLLHIVAAAVVYVLARQVGWWWPRAVALAQWCVRLCCRVYAYGRRYLHR